jgi:hypothetical protein
MMLAHIGVMHGLVNVMPMTVRVRDPVRRGFVRGCAFGRTDSWHRRDLRGSDLRRSRRDFREIGLRVLGEDGICKRRWRTVGQLTPQHVPHITTHISCRQRTVDFPNKIR